MKKRSHLTLVYSRPPRKTMIQRLQENAVLVGVGSILLVLAIHATLVMLIKK